MLAENLDNYFVTDSENQDYRLECSSWEHIKMWPERPID
jgi:hypothetical protein